MSKLSTQHGTPYVSMCTAVHLCRLPAVALQGVEKGSFSALTVSYSYDKGILWV